jgi:hypothetical protein
LWATLIESFIPSKSKSPPSVADQVDPLIEPLFEFAVRSYQVEPDPGYEVALLASRCINKLVSIIPPPEEVVVVVVDELVEVVVVLVVVGGTVVVLVVELLVVVVEVLVVVVVIG